MDKRFSNGWGILFLVLLGITPVWGQGKIYSSHPTLKNILQNISKLPIVTTSTPNTLHLSYYESTDSTFINLADSILMFVEDTALLALDCLDHPLYALYSIEVLTQELPASSFKSKLAAYQKDILSIYETTYQNLASLPLENRVLYGDDERLAILAHSYDLAFIYTNEITNNPPRVLFSTNSTKQHSPNTYFIDFDEPNYLVRIKAQSDALQKGLSLRPNSNPLLYWAVGGTLVGILISIVFHQFYWKKTTIQ